MDTHSNRVLLAAMVALAGCYDAFEPPPGSGSEELRYQLCGTETTRSELVTFLDGNLVIVASHREHGVSAGAIAGGLVLGLVLNGIDFSNLAYQASFSNGEYQIDNGDASLGFTLFFAEDFGAHAAGEVIPYNLFDIDSYLQNIEVVGLDPVSGTVTVDYDHGPLYDLIDGEVDIDADNPLDLSFRVRIRADLIAFEAESQRTYNGRAPREQDELRVVMTTTRAPLLEVYEQFLAGGYGFQYTGTQYDSVYYGIDQELTDALFLMTSDGDGGWYWRGDYRSTVIKRDQTMYQSGFTSNLEQNYTEYYCDAARGERAGAAEHALDLTGGEFVFEDGTRVPYGLAPF
jgi:hypothetical protein